MKALTERTLREMKQAHVLCSLYGYDVTLPELGGWTVDHSGVYICETNAMGNAKVVTACRVPVVISALFEDVEKGDQGVELAFYVNKSWQFLTCKRSDIADRHRIVALVDKGLPVTSESSRPLVRYLNDFLYDNIDLSPKTRSSRASAGTGSVSSPTANSRAFRTAARQGDSCGARAASRNGRPASSVSSKEARKCGRSSRRASPPSCSNR